MRSTLTRVILTITVAMGLLANGAGAQTSAPFATADRSRVPYMTANSSPVMSCAALPGLGDHDVSIIAATAVGTGDELPAHCRVEGVILPAVRFWLLLPENWNGRFYMFGNGGFAGQSADEPLVRALVLVGLQHGFAAAFTDTGHDQTVRPLGTFAHDDLAAEVDYAFRAVHVTAVTAKTLIERFYGSAPRFSYFNGCSTGGRQGLISAQRFPQDFDGIVVGAPVLDFTGTIISYLHMMRALTDAAFTPAHLERLSTAVYDRCDAVDGLEDGLIDDPRACPFEPGSELPRCPSGSAADTCFSDTHVHALEQIYAGVIHDGAVIFPGLPVGSEISADQPPFGRSSGWIPWLVRGTTRGFEGPIAEVFAETFLKYLAFEQDDPTYGIQQFDLERDLPRMARARRLLNATDPDLRPYRARGGKILMYFGWADAGLNPLMGVDYFERMDATMNGASDFFRLFMLPGVFHCQGGVGPDKFDAMTPLIEWVESGHAPQRLQAAKIIDSAIQRTRPLCPYPQVARYSGAGDSNDAVNFDCSDP